MQRCHFILLGVLVATTNYLNVFFPVIIWNRLFRAPPLTSEIFQCPTETQQYKFKQLFPSFLQRTGNTAGRGGGRKHILCKWKQLKKKRRRRRSRSSEISPWVLRLDFWVLVAFSCSLTLCAGYRMYPPILHGPTAKWWEAGEPIETRQTWGKELTGEGRTEGSYHIPRLTSSSHWLHSEKQEGTQGPLTSPVT